MCVCVTVKPDQEAPKPLFLPAPCWDNSTTKITLAKNWRLEESWELEVTKRGDNCGAPLDVSKMETGVKTTYLLIPKVVSFLCFFFFCLWVHTAKVQDSSQGEERGQECPCHLLCKFLEIPLIHRCQKQSGKLQNGDTESSYMRRASAPFLNQKGPTIL